MLRVATRRSTRDRRSFVAGLAHDLRRRRIVCARSRPRARLAAAANGLRRAPPRATGSHAITVGNARHARCTLVTFPLPYWTSNIALALSELSAWTVTFCTEPFGNLMFAVYDGIAMSFFP